MKASNARRVAHGLWIAMALLWVSSLVMILVDRPSDAAFIVLIGLPAAIYFCCLEAMQNIAKYANANDATIRLGRSNGDLTFEVVDDGRGFDPATAGGSGLTNMRDRVEAVGGTLEIQSEPGIGTTVLGRVPVER